VGDAAPDPDRQPPPPAAGDPRLRIPEVLKERPGDRPERSKTPPQKSFSDAAKAWGMVLDLFATSLLALGVGWLFDWWRGTTPWGAIIGLAIGFATAAVRLVRQSLRAEARERAERESRR
jgi:F0F1-type ATP synthase assembly protein I